MIDNPITTLVSEELEETVYYKWKGTFAAPNGLIYGIPFGALKVVKFNPVDKSMTRIGPDFGDDEWKWIKGAITASGVIYSLPCDDERGILKIDTNTDTVTVLNANLRPEQGHYMWISCAAAIDGCVYFMPYMGHRVMKLDPNNNDAMSSVGDDLGNEQEKCCGTCIGIDGCVYGIPNCSKLIIKYDPINGITSFVGEVADEYFHCNNDGALGRDGCIYALATGGRVLKIDTTNNVHCFVGNSILLENCDQEDWGDAILGIDGCIYWPPCDSGYTLKYDPYTDQISLVGDDFGNAVFKWDSGALATDKVIYCIPKFANRVLAIDPLRDLLETTKAHMEDHPEKFRLLFQQTIEG